MKPITRVIYLASFAVFGIPTLLWGQVGATSGAWRHGDPINNRACRLLTDGKVAMNETRQLSAEELAERCSTGLRLTLNASFEEPTSIVILIGLKSNARLEGIPLIGWHEYWFGDTSALTLNRVTKFLELVDGEKIAKVVSESPLWSLKNQSEIEGFKTRVADGYSVKVELFSGGKSKTLRYANPEAYEQEENLQFRAALHLLLSDLKLSSENFVYGLSDLEGVKLPSPHKVESEGAAGQPAPQPGSNLKEGDKPQPDAE